VRSDDARIVLETRGSFKPATGRLHHDARMRTILALALLSTAAVVVHGGPNGVTTSAGGGSYTVVSASGDPAEMQFGYSAIAHKNGRATGQFHTRDRSRDSRSSSTRT
jgi:hypothetical protein